MTRIQRVAAASSSTNVPVLPQFAVFAKLAKEFKTGESELEFETAPPEYFWPAATVVGEILPAFRCLINEEMVLIEAKRAAGGELEGAGKVYKVVSPKGELTTKAKSIITTAAKITSGAEQSGAHFPIGASITGGSIPANTTVVGEKSSGAGSTFEVTLSAAPTVTEAALAVTLSGRHFEGTTEANHPAGASVFLFVTKNSAEDYASRIRDEYLAGTLTPVLAKATTVEALSSFICPVDAEFGKVLEVGFSGHQCSVQYEQLKIKLEESPNNYAIPTGHHLLIEPATENRSITGASPGIGRLEYVIWCAADTRANRNTLTLKNETVGFNAKTESASPELTEVSSFSKLAIGQKLIGKGIPLNTEISELKEAESKIKMNKNANATLTSHAIESIVETASEEANRFRFYPPEDIVLHPNQSVCIFYDNLSTEKRWRNSP